MSGRMWRWAAILAVLAAIDLAATIHTALTWQAPAGTQAVTTLGQVLGFASSAVLIIILTMILATGWRVRRARRRTRAWTSQL